MLPILRRLPAIAVAFSLLPVLASAQTTAPALSAGDTAWMLTSTTLVLFMTLPGLALFYGGLVRVKNFLSVLMHCFAVACLASVLWVLGLYSLSFSEGNDWIGGLGAVGLQGIGLGDLAGRTYPETVFVMFQMAFAIITPALIIGAFVERMKFSAMLLFTALWLLIVYAPVTHWVWGGGWMQKMGVIDLAGGIVVHATAGISALILAKFVGPRAHFPSHLHPPHSPGMVMIGASMLWVGWFGFNAGSNLEANGYAALAMVNTLVATAAAGISWVATEWVTRKRASALGLASGLVAGLVAITPAAGFAGPVGAVILGLVVSPVCVFFCSKIKNALKYDDSLDAFGIHAVGGIVGAIATGLLVNPAWGGAGVVDYTTCGLDGDVSTCDTAAYVLSTQVMAQVKAVLVSVGWSAVASSIVFFVIKYTVGLRSSLESEEEGLDISEFGERAYHS